MNTKRKSLLLHQEGISSPFSCELIDSSASPRREDILISQWKWMIISLLRSINWPLAHILMYFPAHAWMACRTRERGWGVFMSWEDLPHADPNCTAKNSSTIIFTFHLLSLPAHIGTHHYLIRLIIHSLAWTYFFRLDSSCLPATGIKFISICSNVFTHFRVIISRHHPRSRAIDLIKWTLEQLYSPQYIEHSIRLDPLLHDDIEAYWAWDPRNVMIN